MAGVTLQSVFISAGFVGAQPTISGTFPSPVTAGSFIEVFVTNDISGGGAVTCADDVNGSYGAAKDTAVSAPENQRLTVFVLGPVAAGTTTVTASFTPNEDARELYMREISGVSAFQLAAIQNQIGVDTDPDEVSSGAESPTAAPAYVTGFTYASDWSGTPNTGTDYDDDGDGWNYAGAAPQNMATAESKSVSNTNPVAATFTAAGNGNFLTGIVIYTEAGGGDPAANNSLMFAP